jgi:hypothetical protein
MRPVRGIPMLRTAVDKEKHYQQRAEWEVQQVRREVR